MSDKWDQERSDAINKGILGDHYDGPFQADYFGGIAEGRRRRQERSRRQGEEALQREAQADHDRIHARWEAAVRRALAQLHVPAADDYGGDTPAFCRAIEE